MMFTAHSFVLYSAIFLQTILASPLPKYNKHAKRSTAGQNVGSGVAIAVCMVLLAGIFYYLGMRHERTMSWFGKRSPATAPSPMRDDRLLPEGPRHMRQISCPVAVKSSAPIKPYEEPVEAPTPSLRYYELPIKEVHEMGLPSPKKPPPRVSWLSLDRKPWWLKSSEDEAGRESATTSRSKSMRSWFKRDSSMSNVQEKAHPSPELNEAACLATLADNKEDIERKSDGSTLMDWSGLDYVRKIYIGRKSRIES